MSWYCSLKHSDLPVAAERMQYFGYIRRDNLLQASQGRKFGDN